MANKKFNPNTRYTLADLTAFANTPACKTRDTYHALWLNAKRSLTQDECATLWAVMKPKASGVADFAGKGWRKDHPDDVNPMPAYIADAQAERAKAKAEAPAKQEKAPAKKAPAKQEKAPAKKSRAAKQPTQKEVLARILVTLDSMDKRLTALEKKQGK